MLGLLLALSLTPRIGPYVAEVGTDSAELRWSAEVPGPLLVGSAGAVQPTLVEGIYRARVVGLLPDHLYRYHLPGETADRSFQTLPAAGSPVFFAVLGDTRSGHEVHARLAARLALERPDFVVDTGDLVESGDEEAVWPAFFEAARPLLAVSPLVAVPGNHDERGLLNDSRWDRYFPRGRYWYELEAGDLRLLVIDSNRSFDATSAQGRWIRERLAAAAAAKARGTVDWIVIAHHHPAYSSSLHGGEATIQRELVPLYEAYGVDLVLSGHDHLYERLERNGITYLVSGGGGAPLYDIRRLLPGSRAAAKVHHYLRVKTDRSRLTVEAIDMDGNAIDRATLLRDRPRGPFPPAPSDGRVVVLSLAALLAAAGCAWWQSSRWAG